MLEKTVMGYRLTEDFTTLMAEFENNQTVYSDAVEIRAYRKHEERTEDMMENHRAAMLTGVLVYSIRHPIRIFRAQRYYHYDFGKPCKLRQGDDPEI